MCFIKIQDTLWTATILSVSWMVSPKGCKQPFPSSFRRELFFSLCERIYCHLVPRSYVFSFSFFQIALNPLQWCCITNNYGADHRVVLIPWQLLVTLSSHSHTFLFWAPKMKKKMVIQRNFLSWERSIELSPLQRWASFCTHAFTHSGTKKSQMVPVPSAHLSSAGFSS